MITMQAADEIKSLYWDQVLLGTLFNQTMSTHKYTVK